MNKVIAKSVEVDADGNLIIDGVTLPWHLSPEWEIAGGNGLYGLTVTIYADRVVMDSSYGFIDTRMEEARAEAIAIVREGLKDVLEWLES